MKKLQTLPTDVRETCVKRLASYLLFWSAWSEGSMT